MTDASLQPTFVLHRRPYRETSLLMELFARDAGRVGVVARGARRRGARPLEPFVELQARWGGRGDLGQLYDAEPVGGAVPLRGTALYSGFYLNELLLRLLRRHDPHPELYADYVAALAALAAAGDTVEAVLRLFERQLLEACGYGLQLLADADDGRPIDPDGQYRYQPEHGPVLVVDATRRGVPVHGRALLALADGKLHDPRDLRELKRLLRTLLEPHLGSRPLASRRLFRSGARTRPADPVRGA